MSKCKKFRSVFEYTLSASIFFPVFLLFSVLKFDSFIDWLDLEKKDLSWEIFLEISSLLSLHPSLLSLLLSFDVCRSSLPRSTASSCPADLRVRRALVDISFTDSEASSWMQKVHNYLKGFFGLISRCDLLCFDCFIGFVELTSR